MGTDRSDRIGLRSEAMAAEEYSMKDPGFWWEFVGKVGAPIFAATLVACLLSEGFAPLHGVLMVAGLGMMGVCHWRSHHQVRKFPDT
jgi:hypothetical protein